MAIRSWITSSLVRHFPLARAGRAGPLSIDAALNEQFSFQVALRSEEREQPVQLEVTGPRGWSLRIRRAGLVPVRHLNMPVASRPEDIDGLGHIPGFVPDPLFDEDSMLLPQRETHAFWVTVRPGPRAHPGEHNIDVRVIPEKGRSTAHDVPVRLHGVVLGKRKGFPITHWFYVDSLIDWYRTDLFDRRFWRIVEPYIRDVVAHGQNTLLVPVFTPPLDGVKRPSQLLRVRRTAAEKYRFDWRDVRRYVRLARSCGVEHFEWSHPFTQWGVRNAIRIYEGQGRDEKLLWRPSTSATSGVYRRFLAQYLPQLRRFLTDEKILRRSFFHVSDEPHGAEHLTNYRKARQMLRDLAPWMNVMDALSDVAYAREGLTDMPVPSIQAVDQFLAEDIPCWCYYCCGPRGAFLNRLLDTPLAKIAMHGLLFYRWPTRGFLHWGYNYWYRSQTRNLIDPYVDQDAQWWPRWVYGDPFVVYPGPDGPVDSMRWEVFGESLQDYRLLQTLGVDRGDRLLSPIRSFQDFPKTIEWRRRLRRKLLSGANQ